MSEKETNKKEEKSGMEVGLLRKGFFLGTLLVLILIGLIAIIQLYTNVSSAIDIWISDEYVHIFQAAFNLIVLLLVGIGILKLLEKYKIDL